MNMIHNQGVYASRPRCVITLSFGATKLRLLEPRLERAKTPVFPRRRESPEHCAIPAEAPAFAGEQASAVERIRPKGPGNKP